MFLSRWPLNSRSFSSSLLSSGIIGVFDDFQQRGKKGLWEHWRDGGVQSWPGEVDVGSQRFKDPVTA